MGFFIEVITLGDGDDYIAERDLSDCHLRDVEKFPYASPTLYMNTTSEYIFHYSDIQEAIGCEPIPSPYDGWYERDVNGSRPGM